MMPDIDSVALIALIVCGVLGFAACLHIVRAERANGVHRLANAVGTRIGRHGIWAGAWLVTIPSALAQRVRDEAKAAGPVPPERIFDLWRQNRARLFTHLAGPEVSTEAEACGWLAHVSNELAETSLPALAAGDDRSVFALVYACTKPPPTRGIAFDELRDLIGPACIGAAFVACVVDARVLPNRIPVRVISAAKWVFLAAAVAGLVYAGASRAFEPQGETKVAGTAATAATLMPDAGPPAAATMAADAGGATTTPADAGASLDAGAHANPSAHANAGASANPRSRPTGPAASGRSRRPEPRRESGPYD